MSKFSKGKKRKDPAISTAALPDIVFMLLFFFMVTTVFKEKESNKILIDKVVEQSINKDKIYYDFKGSPLKFLHIRFLEPNLKKKFIHIKDIENFNGEYYMFVLSRWGLNLRNFYKDKKDIVFEVKFDDIPVNGVYKNFID